MCVFLALSSCGLLCRSSARLTLSDNQNISETRRRLSDSIALSSIARVSQIISYRYLNDSIYYLYSRTCFLARISRQL
ncbi:uncharacterized protein EDB91DRAFT_1158624 [Suillus paluster]|uniref:uncharacterized protein n=1 Tax=Suillus paluster TaxID=48578 RepID=UPI001B866789|nr:uncharacterized protein EDB91DRAFT_1158624 [Suillus paluster]KAG1729984.1 hypothetical protein EDB91DRAFT_1158624 [Suillus paluster]